MMLVHACHHKVIDDPSGNSFVENKMVPHKDTNLTVEHYERSEDQNRMLGLITATQVSEMCYICTMYIF